MAEFHVTFHPGGPAAAAPSAKELEAEDPYELVGLTFEVPPDHDVDLLMARTFVEEYALMGYSRPALRKLFETPFYAGTHDILVRRGPAYVDSVLDEVFGAEVPGDEAGEASAGAAPADEGTSRG
ncbi:MAG: hypothetical protein K1X95_04845 [Acidimicrobiia bacterium]|nr:hypothetical protein [Acidimicrobiia bacterium]